MSTNRMRQWMAAAERSLACLCIQEGLQIGLVRAIQGPMTITFTLRLLRPSKASLAKLLALGPAMGQALACSGVRVSDTASGILVEVPAPVTRTPGAERLARASRGLRVAIGLNSLRRPVYLDFDRWPHLLAVGPTRRGKSQALRSLLYCLARCNSPRRIQLLILAKKREDWRDFQPYAGCLGLLSRPAEQEQALAWLAGDLLQDRAEEGQKWPRLFLVADDLSNITARASLAGYLGEIASMGGGAGIHLLISTQTTGKAGGLTQDIEQNIVARLIFGAGDSAAGARYAGQGGLQVEAVGIAPGDALLLLDGQPQRVATGLCSDRFVSLLPEGELEPPWILEQPEQPEQASGIPSLKLLVTDREGGPPEQSPEQASQNRQKLDPSRPPTPEERAWIRQLHQELGSKAKATLKAYGHRNGKVHNWVSEALEEEPMD